MNADYKQLLQGIAGYSRENLIAIKQTIKDKIHKLKELELNAALIPNGKISQKRYQFAKEKQGLYTLFSKLTLLLKLKGKESLLLKGFQLQAEILANLQKAGGSRSACTKIIEFSEALKKFQKMDSLTLKDQTQLLQKNSSITFSKMVTVAQSGLLTVKEKDILFLKEFPELKKTSSKKIKRAQLILLKLLIGKKCFSQLEKEILPQLRTSDEIVDNWIKYFKNTPEHPFLKEGFGNLLVFFLILKEKNFARSALGQNFIKISTKYEKKNWTPFGKTIQESVEKLNRKHLLAKQFLDTQTIKVLEGKGSQLEVNKTLKRTKLLEKGMTHRLDALERYVATFENFRAGLKIEQTFTQQKQQLQDLYLQRCFLKKISKEIYINSHKIYVKGLKLVKNALSIKMGGGIELSRAKRKCEILKNISLSDQNISSFMRKEIAFFYSNLEKALRAAKSLFKIF